MTETEITDLLHNILVEQFELNADDLRPDSHLYDELGIDSIDAVDLIVRIKELTGIRIPPEDFKNVRTIQDATNVLKTQLNG